MLLGSIQTENAIDTQTAASPSRRPSFCLFCASLKYSVPPVPRGAPFGPDPDNKAGYRLRLSDESSESELIEIRPRLIDEWEQSTDSLETPEMQLRLKGICVINFVKCAMQDRLQVSLLI